MKAALRVVVRVEAGPAIGGGHAMRCLALADALCACGHAVTFATGEDAAATVPALARHPRAAPDAPADVVVVDHYGLALADERALAHAHGARTIVVVDDLADRMHDCALLLDAGPERRRGDYSGLIPRGVEACLGPGFALLRPDFAGMREASLARRTDAAGIDRAVVAFGLSDASPIVAAALDALAAALPHVPCDLVVGPAGAAAAEALARGRPHVRLHVDPPDYPALLAAADLAVGAAGGSAFERCVLGLPSLAVPIAANQAGNARALAAAGAAMVVAPGEDLARRLADALAGLAAAPERLQALGAAAARLCDGEGAARAAAAIERAAQAPPARPALPGALVLRRAEPRDAGRLLAWRNDPATRAASRETAPIAFADHAAWLARRLSDEAGTRLLVAEEDCEPVGTLRLDRGARANEVSLAVSPLARGRGVAARMLAALTVPDGWPPGLAAAVRADNAASRRLFEAAGFALAREEADWLHLERRGRPRA